MREKSEGKERSTDRGKEREERDEQEREREREREMCLSVCMNAVRKFNWLFNLSATFNWRQSSAIPRGAFCCYFCSSRSLTGNLQEIRKSPNCKTMTS